MSSNGRLEKWAEDFKLRQERRAMLPPWVLWVHMIIMAAGLTISVLGYVFLVRVVHDWIHPGVAINQASSLAQNLMLIPMFTGMFGPCFVIGNFLEWAIVPIRRQWEIHLGDVPGGSLADALRATAWLMLVWLLSMGVSVVGAIDPWAQHS
ncbi:MAG: hypothetical protein ABSD74_07345 [Rhizomicrobium sp.]|jgi:hypothetical protein